MKMGRKTTMVMMKNNQVGYDNYYTSVQILTLFAEATLGCHNLSVPSFHQSY